MTSYAFSDASMQIYERENILFSKFSGKLTEGNLAQSFKIWTNRLNNTKIDIVFADFTKAVVEIDSETQLQAHFSNCVSLLDEITVHAPQELCSRILLKNLFNEYKYNQSKEGFNFRFVDSAFFSSNLGVRY